MILLPAQEVKLITAPKDVAGPSTAVDSLTNIPALIT